jgi:hypothetical protein
MTMGTLEELTEKRSGIKLSVGETITGTITATSSQQSINFDTQQPDTFDGGAPKMLAVFVLHLDGAEDEQPLYVQWWGSQRYNLEKGLAAFKAANGRGPQPGDRMRVQYVRDETQQDRDERGVKRTPPIPAKLYRYDFSAGVPVAPEPVGYGDDTPF